jgi:hypothetical protein
LVRERRGQWVLATTNMLRMPRVFNHPPPSLIIPKTPKTHTQPSTQTGIGAGCGFGLGWGFGGSPIGFLGMGLGGGCGVGVGLGWGFGTALGAQYLNVKPRFARAGRPSFLDKERKEGGGSGGKGGGGKALRRAVDA